MYDKIIVGDSMSKPIKIIDNFKDYDKVLDFYGFLLQYWRHCANIRNVNKGKVISEESRKKMSESRKGISPGNKGKKMTPEQCRKLSESKKGKPGVRRGKTYGHRVYNPDGTWRVVK